MCHVAIHKQSRAAMSRLVDIFCPYLLRNKYVDCLQQDHNHSYFSIRLSKDYAHLFSKLYSFLYTLETKFKIATRAPPTKFK